MITFTLSWIKFKFREHFDERFWYHSILSFLTMLLFYFIYDDTV